MNNITISAGKIIKTIFAFLILILLITSSLTSSVAFPSDRSINELPNHNQEPRTGESSSSSNEVREVDGENTDKFLGGRSRTRTAGIEEKSNHGGSWLDSFKDESCIDLLLSDHINTTGSDVTLNNTGYVKAFEDNFSKPLNTTSWINNTGGGTDLYTHPELKATKNFEAQTFKAYVETNQSRNYLQIVEWDWNSVWDTPWNGFQHEIYVFKGDTKNIVVIIRADRTIMVLDSVKLLYQSSPGVISANTWYRMRMKIENDQIDFEIKDMFDTTIVKQILTSAMHPIMQKGTFKVIFAGESSSTSGAFDIRLDNFDLYEKKFYTRGNLTSSKIELPAGMEWDNLIIRKTEPINTSIKVAVMNGETNQVLTGYDSITHNGELDLSDLNSLELKSIRLKAVLAGTFMVSPTLDYWGVSWISNSSWRDTLYGGSRVSSSDGIEMINGTASCAIPQKLKGYLNSSNINIPHGFYYDTLIINKTEPLGTQLKVTIVDAFSGEPISGFTDMLESQIDISSIDPKQHPKIRLQAYFEAYSAASAVLFDWSLNWTPNTSPYKIELYPDLSTLNRTAPGIITINAFDNETNESILSIELFHQHSYSSDWGDDFLSNPRYTYSGWAINFTPSRTAVVGPYNFKVICKDEFFKTRVQVFEDVIHVSNNLPTKPELMIEPTNPQTKDDLIADARYSTDIEDETITYGYSWYKNGELQVNLTSPFVGRENTSKGEIWRCEAVSFDGNPGGYGPPVNANVTILNTGPEVRAQLGTIKIKEDEIDDSSINLANLFYDVDGDTLEYSCSNQNNLTVSIDQNDGAVSVIPPPNWFGRELLTFTANDTEEVISESVEVVVIPQNDPPSLLEVGDRVVESPEEVMEFDVLEGNIYNMTLKTEDIDGDMVTFLTNRSDRIGTDDIADIFIRQNELIFQPKNEHVGSISLDLSISDLNGSTVFYELKFDVQNINNPPYVRIIEPYNGTVFKFDDIINLSCGYSDPDLLIPNPDEILYFTWMLNTSSVPLGSNEYLYNLTDVKLEPGAYEITVEVKDQAGEVAEDTIVIVIEEEELEIKKEAPSDEPLNPGWIVMIVVMTIMLLIIIIFVLRQYKTIKPEVEYEPASAGETALPGTVAARSKALAPSSVTEEQVPGIAVSPQLPVSAPTPTSPQSPPEPLSAPVPTLPPLPPQQPEPSAVASTHDAVVAQEAAPAPTPETAGEQELPEEPSVEEKAKFLIAKEALDKLEELGEEKEKGLLSEEEFNKRKKDILKEV